MPIKGCFIKKELKARGWSDAMVEEFLGEPDDYHNYGRGIVANLYTSLRVTEAEARPEWQRESRAFKLRSLRAKQGITTRTRRLIESVKAHTFQLPRFTPEKLLAAAIQNRNNIAWNRCERRQNWEEYNEVDPATIPLWPEPHAARDRWCVNFLRHRTTSYDSFRRVFLPGRAGQVEALAAWWSNFVEAIRKVYPFLEDEAQRQARTYNEST